MLVELHISGLGVIQDVTVELAPGLNVLTGETGAGKTMVTVALGLALGERASATVVRAGADAARVEARFRAPDVPELSEWSEDDELILSRSVSAEGRSSARAGGQIVPLSALASMAPRLVEVHGQHEHQRLLSPAAQLEFVDRFAGADHLRVLTQFRRVFGQLRDARARLDDLERAERDREREKDLLAYQVREIEGTGLAPGELASLADEARRLEHAEALTGLAAEAEAGLGEEGAAADALARAAGALERASALDPAAAELAGRLRSLAAEAADAAAGIRAYRESVEADPARLDAVQERIAAIRGLERKYGEGEIEILRFLGEARSRLAALEGTDAERARLESEVTRLSEEAATRAIRIRRERAAAGSTLAGAIEVELWDLGMQGASVAVELLETDLGPDGGERAEIHLAAGSGQQRLPLRKAASGGELSRTMLACRSVLADLDDVPTLVFDEVDAGIGGRAGVAVGRRLARIARGRQVLVVTHLPQIAAFADRHLRVEKLEGTARIESLDEAGRVEELSRMLAGLPESEAASSHAEELLAQAAKEKGS